MLDFGQMRFDDRALRLVDDGADFEVFVFQYFSEIEPHLKLLRNIERKADGAIDLSTRDSHSRCFIECKFIGATSQGTPNDRWRDVSNNLSRNLLSAAQDEGGAANAYRPWLSGPNNINEYRFCSSALSKTLAARDELEGKIRAFFLDASTKHHLLSHLSAITVSVHYWDDFISHSTTCPPLFFRWFGGLPSGLNELSYSFGTVGSFKRFLGDDLPFFSRAEFTIATDDNQSGDELRWLQTLDSGIGGRAMIVYGPGGIGKTRLSIELCSRLKGLGWWPLRVEEYASADSVVDVLRSYSKAAKVALFIDYAERFKQLNRLWELVERATREHQHELRLVVSCRASAFQRVSDGLADFVPVPIHLGRDLGERDGGHFERWVVEQILSHFQIPRANEVADVCGKLPVLAAFAAFLQRTRPVLFEEQFGRLLGIHDFLTWAYRRIDSMISSNAGANSAAYEALANLALQLPMSANEARAFQAEAAIHNGLFETLLSDHWIESDGKDYAATHDVFADALVARYVFGLPGLETRRLCALLRHHQAQNRFNRALMAANRLMSHKDSNNIDGLAIVRELLDADRQSTLDSAVDIVESRLLDSYGIVALIGSEADFKERLATSPESFFKISFVAEAVARIGKEHFPNENDIHEFGLLLRTAVNFPHQSNIVLRRAFLFDPDRYLTPALDRMRAEPTASQTGYLIGAALDCAIAIETLEPIAQLWLTENETQAEASFVYTKWLRAGGTCDKIQSSMFIWLQRFSRSDDAGFVYEAFLDAKGATNEIEPYLLDLLVLNGHKERASFLLAKQAKAGRHSDEVKQCILRWIARHGRSIAATHVFEAWCEVGGAFSDIETYLRCWLVDHASEESAGPVFRSWSALGGTLDEIRPYVLSWLKANDKKETATHAFQCWSDGGGSIAEIQPHLHSWLMVHSMAEQATVVFELWIGSGGSFENIKTQMVNWLGTKRLRPPRFYLRLGLRHDHQPTRLGRKC